MSEEIKEILERRSAPDRVIFEFFGYAITAVTWIAFCIVTLVLLYDWLFEHRTLGLKGRAAIVIIAPFGAAALTAIFSSIVLFVALIRIAHGIQQDLSERRGAVAWVVRELDHYFLLGCILLVAIIAGTLSYQALMVLR